MKSIVRFIQFAAIFVIMLARTASPQGLPVAAPEKAGLSSERLNRIGPVMQKYVDEKRIPGCVTLIARHGKVVHLESFGVMDMESGALMRTDTIFRIASMTKPVTAVAAMILYEEGRFLLSDPISKYIPEFRDMKILVPSAKDDSHTLVPAEREITIRHLLNHTSGITYGEGGLMEYYAKTLYTNGFWTPEGTIGDMVKKLAGLPLAHQPGEAWSYGLSNDVIGYFIEVISGMPLDEFFRERIFEPLGMQDTYFYPPKEKLSRLATYYLADKDKGLVRQSQKSIDYMHKGPRKYFSGGGGLCSTAPDYIRFSQMLLSGGELYGTRILSRKTVELMTTDSTGGIDILKNSYDTRATQGDRYGLGLGIRVYPGDIESLGTFGWAGAFHTFFWVDPKEDMIGIFMSQVSGEPDKSQHRKFRVMAYSAIID